jgi:hypothetical protein
MAAKNGGSSGDKNRNPGAASSDDDREIQRLIDGNGDGGRGTEGESSTTGNENGGNGTDSESGGSESGSGGKPSGGGKSGGGESGSNSGAGAGAGAGKRTSANSGSSGRTESGDSADQKTRKVGDSVSRKQQLKTPKQPKIDADPIEIPGTNKEIIGDVFQFCFWGIAQATGIPEWELEDADALQIGENGDKWLKSLGPKRAKNVVNGLKKIGPSVAFFGSLGMAIVPRVKVTIDRAKNGAIKPIKERNPAGNSPDSAPRSDHPTSGGSDSDFAPGLHARPFAAQDFSEATEGQLGEATGG